MAMGKAKRRRASADDFSWSGAVWDAEADGDITGDEAYRLFEELEEREIRERLRLP